VAVSLYHGPAGGSHWYKSKSMANHFKSVYYKPIREYTIDLITFKQHANFKT